MLRERNFQNTLVSMYGDERATKIRKSLDPECLSRFTTSECFEIEHWEVIIAVDTSDFTFLDFAYEELLQSLGPIQASGDLRIGEPSLNHNTGLPATTAHPEGCSGTLRTAHLRIPQQFRHL